jgi:hypothetical protein
MWYLRGCILTDTSKDIKPVTQKSAGKTGFFVKT